MLIIYKLRFRDWSQVNIMKDGSPGAGLGRSLEKANEVVMVMMTKTPEVQGRNLTGITTKTQMVRSIHLTTRNLPSLMFPSRRSIRSVEIVSSGSSSMISVAVEHEFFRKNNRSHDISSVSEAKLLWAWQGRERRFRYFLYFIYVAYYNTRLPLPCVGRLRKACGPFAHARALFRPPGSWTSLPSRKGKRYDRYHLVLKFRLRPNCRIVMVVRSAVIWLMHAYKRESHTCRRQPSQAIPGVALGFATHPSWTDASQTYAPDCSLHCLCLGWAPHALRCSGLGAGPSASSFCTTRIALISF